MLQQRDETYQRACLYNVDWQLKRIDMLGSWGTEENVTRSLTKCGVYCSDDVKDRWERYTRVSNYMTAIMLSYGNKDKFKEHNRMVRIAHQYFVTELEHFSPLDSQWDWSVVRQDLALQDDLIKLGSLHKDLLKRIDTSKRRTGGVQHRPELMRFFHLLERRLALRIRNDS